MLIHSELSHNVMFNVWYGNYGLVYDLMFNLSSFKVNSTQFVIKILGK